MKTFTVIGYYEDNQQAHASTVKARSAHEAFARGANRAPEYGGDLLFVCAVGDGHEVFTPTDEQGAQDVCAARDFPAEYGGWLEDARELTEEEKHWVEMSGDESAQEIAYDNGFPVNAVRKYMESRGE